MDIAKKVFRAIDIVLNKTQNNEKAIDGENFKPVGNEVYFCYDTNETWVVIGNTPTIEKPSNTGSTIINQVNITYDFNQKSFKKV